MKYHVIIGLLLTAVCSLNAEAGQKPQDVSQAVKQPTSSLNQQLLSVNINTASVSELARLKGIGESKAKAIVEFRKANGEFKAITELEQVKGIGAKLVEKNKSVIVL
ncbi:competence protein ComEA [Shewanella hanedai]|jgi:competence protein ComEA|uniref:Helix-hairpin-helix domain-containing protein n=1 Tax=Shewanella hanedai TaxID=25 RepID=A0A553JPK4_SHEHA|nr:helix-hairpin-helix domain-containing protein [Shewanella hanedai]TRY14392.1 helix-hairpin-helix domain-containing protein [Shewanella hanedai]GGI79295.1 competence protein ComEA [Shewanella hanedai]